MPTRLLETIGEPFVMKQPDVFNWLVFNYYLSIHRFCNVRKLIFFYYSIAISAAKVAPIWVVNTVPENTTTNAVSFVAVYSYTI